MYSPLNGGASSPSSPLKVPTKPVASPGKTSSLNGTRTSQLEYHQLRRQFVNLKYTDINDNDHEVPQTRFPSKPVLTKIKTTSSVSKGPSPNPGGSTTTTKPMKTPSVVVGGAKTATIIKKQTKTSLPRAASKLASKKDTPLKSTPSSPPASGSQRQAQPQSLKSAGQCSICNKACRSHCAGCKRVYYCCKQHQQQDWPSHKLVCRPFSIPTQFKHKSIGLLPARSSQTRLDSSSAEHQFMIATKQISPGHTLFTEKPLLVTVNICGTDSPEKVVRWCSACLQKVGTNLTPRGKLTTCSKCHFLPLCQNCLNDPNGNASARLLHPGQGHSPEECAFLAEFVQKFPEYVRETPTQNFIKDLSILRILFFRKLCRWRWESLLCLRNSPRYIACCKHGFGKLEEAWLQFDYPMASHYFTNVCKEKSVQLLDIAKLVAVFSEVSCYNKDLLVLYEIRSWIGHACTPNAELFYRRNADEPNMEIVVKAVNVIEEGTKVLLNYLPNFDDGRSPLALKLFRREGLHCSEMCCRPNSSAELDMSLGIRCDLIKNVPVDKKGSPEKFNACSGIIAPRLDPPNPEKANLGQRMFAKIKKWECDKCNKSQKYEDLQKNIADASEEVTKACDSYCLKNKYNPSKSLNESQTFLLLQNKLSSNLSSDHWLVWKGKMRFLKVWNDKIGFGQELLRTAVAGLFPAKKGLIQIVKQKVALYGKGIYQKTEKGKMGVLELIGKRHGEFSPRRGELLLDAFYANLILFMEDYKNEVPLLSELSPEKMTQLANETSKRLVALREILDKSVECLKIGEGLTIFNTEARVQHQNFNLFRVAQDSLDILTPICARIEQHPSSVIGFMNDLLEMYSCLDIKFVDGCLKRSQIRPKDPFLNHSGPELEFETDSGYFGPFSLTFGPAAPKNKNGNSGRPSIFSGSNQFSFDKKKSYFESTERKSRFDPGSGSRWNSTNFDFDLDNDDDFDFDLDDNPFVYSSDKKNSTSNQKSKEQNKTKPNTDDWTSYLSLSSDDDNDDDGEFDFGFSGGGASSSRFNYDIYDDDALEDLAEWAAMQFMMGKMRV